jgi:hypothetical protein
MWKVWVTGEMHTGLSEGGGEISISITKYYSGDQTNKMRWAEHFERVSDRRVSYRTLVGRPEGNRPLGITSLDGKTILK